MAVTVEQARRISEATGVDVIAALSALERNNGDALAAVLELERKGLAPVPPGGGFSSTRSPQGGTASSSGPDLSKGGEGTRRHGKVLVITGSDLWRNLKDLFHSCLATRLEVWRKGWQAASVPLPILAVLLLFFFLEIAVVLGVGLLLGFRYRLSGPITEGKTARGLLASLRDAFDHFAARLRRP